MVDHNHNRIKPGRKREISDEIDRELLEGERDSGRDWTQRRNSRMSVDLVLLANSTTHDEMLDKGGKAQPPEIMFKDRLGVKDPHVARKGGSMNRMEEGRAGRGRNIKPFAEIKWPLSNDQSERVAQ